MKINVGTSNKIKIGAVKDALFGYDDFSKAEVVGLAVSSGVSDQPKTIDEIMRGALNRAKNSFTNCDISFGIESGIMVVPHTKTGYMEITACVIYDGKEFHTGLSSSFECPKPVIRVMLSEGLDINQAFNKAGLTTNKDLGSDIGAVGVLTRGRVTRKDYTKQAITMALIHLESSFVPEKRKKLLTLCLIHRHPKILLGMKKRGFGEGRWNGFGGKVQAGETIEEAAKRETFEEAGIVIDKIEKTGIIDFEFLGKPEILEVHIFRGNEFAGEPKESEEMRPNWFEINEIPFNDMWPDDRHWFPLFLNNKKFKGKFLFDGEDNIIEHQLDEVLNI